jgi:hypothetical protein
VRRKESPNSEEEVKKGARGKRAREREKNRPKKREEMRE